MSDRPLVGLEEEFHVVDLTSRRAAPEVDRLLEQLGGGEEFFPELQRSLVETNSPATASLDELREHVRRLRRSLRAAAEPLGLGVVAAGTVPLVDLSGDDISAGARYGESCNRRPSTCGSSPCTDGPGWTCCRRRCPGWPRQGAWS